MQDIGERKTVHKLHHDVMRALVLAHLENPADVAVRKSRHDFRFAPEAPDRIFRGILGELQRFDRDGVSINILRFPNTPHAARADDLRESILSHPVEKARGQNLVAGFRKIRRLSRPRGTQNNDGLHSRGPEKFEQCLKNKSRLLASSGETGSREPNTPRILTLDRTNQPRVFRIRPQLGILFPKHLRALPFGWQIVQQIFESRLGNQNLARPGDSRKNLGSFDALALGCVLHHAMPAESSHHRIAACDPTGGRRHFFSFQKKRLPQSRHAIHLIECGREHSHRMVRMVARRSSESGHRGIRARRERATPLQQRLRNLVEKGVRQNPLIHRRQRSRQTTRRVQPCPTHC